MVYRRDPDAVRERREKALKGRCFFTETGLDGMGTVGATMSAERAAIVARVVERLAAQGFGEADLARIHGPAGLHIGAANPAEIALSVAAQLQAWRHGRRP